MRHLIVWAILGCFIFSGCDDGVSDSDGGFSLVSSSGVTLLEPSQYTPGSQVSFTFSCECPYSGRGTVGFVGLGGGSNVGTLESPVTADIGDVWYEIDIPGGRIEIPVVIEMTSTLQRPRLEISITCDSLLAGNRMVAWDSEEGWAVFREDIPPNTAFIVNATRQSVVIPRAEN